jgi:hypothetical protein
MNVVSKATHTATPRNKIEMETGLSKETWLTWVSLSLTGMGTAT